jgi:hypothetical protein
MEKWKSQGVRGGIPGAPWRAFGKGDRESLGEPFILFFSFWALFHKGPVPSISFGFLFYFFNLEEIFSCPIRNVPFSGIFDQSLLISIS